MVDWNPPSRDYEFLFNEVFDAVGSIEGLGFDDFDWDFLSMLMEGWGTHVKEVWLPINEIGDRKGLRFEDGKISMPEEFKDAYKRGVEEGWFATSSKPEHGGMGAPTLFQAVTWAEFGTSTCMSLSSLTTTQAI